MADTNNKNPDMGNGKDGSGSYEMRLGFGTIALGFLLVAGRNLPAADYGTIAYWEVPVAIFVGLVVFGEALTINTIIGGLLIIGGGAVPSIRGMIVGRKQKQQEEISENLAARLEKAEEDEHLQ